jgi:hypothetical protein
MLKGKIEKVKGVRCKVKLPQRIFVSSVQTFVGFVFNKKPKSPKNPSYALFPLLLCVKSKNPSPVGRLGGVKNTTNALLLYPIKGSCFVAENI